MHKDEFMDRMVNNIQLTWKLAWILRIYKTCNLTVWFSKYQLYNKLLDGVTLCRVIPVKLLFTTLYFVGLYSVPNLIVMLFNLLYPIFIVGFDCKGCVIERQCEDSSNWRLKSFRGYLTTKHPAKWLMWLAHVGMWRVRIRWRQLCLASISRVRPSRETPARHSVLLACPVWFTLSVHTLFIPTLPTNVRESFWEKTLAKHLKS